MRRELKLVFLILVLIVGPSATLSFLAGRVLGNWQIVLRGRMAEEAERVLDGVATALVAELDGLREQMANRWLPHLVPRSRFLQATMSAADMQARYPWISDVYAVQEGKGLLYPVALTQPGYDPSAVDSKEVESLAALRQADQQAYSSTNAEVAIAAYRRLLEVPDPAPAVNAMVMLRVAQWCRAAQQPERAIESLNACVEISGGSSTRRGASPTPLRDPEEGFYIDLVALGDLADIHATAGRLDAAVAVRKDMRKRIVERFDILPQLQRQWLVAQMVEQGRDKAVHDDLQWRECLRAFAMTSAERDRIERDFGGIPRGMAEEGWQGLRFGTNDYLVTMPDREVHGGVLAVARFDRQSLADTVTALAQKEGRQSGIRVTCEVQDFARKPDSAILTLAERRLAPPLDRFVIIAAPTEPRAFASNARLQKRLYGLGGALLMLGVVVGGLLIWREAVWEIRRAREHSDFAAAVSHDLRTPLSSMRMLAESLYLDRVQDETKRRKFLGAILKESDRLSRLTDRALYFIRYGEGMLRYHFSEGDLGGVVQETVETFATGIGASIVRPDQHQDTGSGWVIQLHIESGLDPVWFDAGAIEQVIFNLLDNAVKYSGHAHEIEVEVRKVGGVLGVAPLCERLVKYVRPQVGATKGEGAIRPQVGATEVNVGKVWRWFRKVGPHTQVEVAVRDHGAGMSKEEVRRIIRPYMRGSKAAEANSRGIGLGLALCRHVIHAHKGRLEINSAEGEGSTFRVILPAGEI